MQWSKICFEKKIANLAKFIYGVACDKGHSMCYCINIFFKKFVFDFLQVDSYFFVDNWDQVI